MQWSDPETTYARHQSGIQTCNQKIFGVIWDNIKVKTSVAFQNTDAGADITKQDILRQLAPIYKPLALCFLPLSV